MNETNWSGTSASTSRARWSLDKCESSPALAKLLKGTNCTMSRAAALPIGFVRRTASPSNSWETGKSNV